VEIYLAAPDLPFFAEYAAFCWGKVDYETQGDCERPTDRRWNWLEVSARATRDRLLVFRPPEAGKATAQFPHPLLVEATASRLVWLAAYLTLRRSRAVAFLKRRGHMAGYAAIADQLLAGEDLEGRWNRCDELRGQFESEALRPYDTPAWWGGWKWEGDFSSPSSAPRRRLLRAVLSGDRSASCGLIDDMERGIPPELHDGYLCALKTLTGEEFAGQAEWLIWRRAH
jgi:hypothetical protein